MAKINIRDLYPSSECDFFIDVPDEVLNAYEDFRREEESRQRSKRRNKIEILSLDCEGACKVEMSIVDKPLAPCEVFAKKEITSMLHAAIAKLPDLQAKRIYAYYFLSMSFTEIAESEGTDKKNVWVSVQRGLRNLEKNLKSFF